MQKDNIFTVANGSYAFSGDSRNTVNFPFKEEWCAGIIVKLAGQVFGNERNGTESIIVISYGKPIYYNVKAWDAWVGWKQ